MMRWSRLGAAACGLTVAALVLPGLLGEAPGDRPAPAIPAASAQEADPWREARLRMVEAQLATAALGRRPVEDEAVLEAMREVPRHEFVPPELVGRAYHDRPLPIGHGQTISQPYMVAHMTELLELRPGARVLEIGTGSGYHAAVIARIAEEVSTVEIIEPLARTAEERLRRLGFENVRVRADDGYHGWAEHASFDAIVVTAAASHIPPPLVEQLRPGGRMVIPVGPPFQIQSLMLVEKREDGSIRQRNLMPVRFVPLTRPE